MSLTAVVLAAGQGTRFGSRVSKPLVKIGPRPIIFFSLSALSRHEAVNEIIVAANPLNKGQIERLVKKYRFKKVRAVVLGGRRRQDSVAAALRVIDPGAGSVLIHDAARPFINRKLISSVIGAARASGAAIAAVPLKATIKQVKGRAVSKTLDRETLWEIQTPQVFKKGLITEAYRKFGRSGVTDDASLVEKLGKKVMVGEGSYSNIKITTPEDLVIAKAIWAAKII